MHMVGRTMRQDETNKHESQGPSTRSLREFQADAAFWRAWHDDPKAMRDSGYRVRKTEKGWRAFIIPR